MALGIVEGLDQHGQIELDRHGQIDAIRRGVPWREAVASVGVRLGGCSVWRCGWACARCQRIGPWVGGQWRSDARGTAWRILRG
jgi:hypothetical protein